MVVLTLGFTTGYGAFQTVISINAKGNIKDYNAAWQLKKKVVSSGNGLYSDIYESDRYVYRGNNPDNFIQIDNELWRIISIEKDETLKIIKNVKIENKAFDVNNTSLWTNNITVSDYLNNQYYETLSVNFKNLIQNHNFNIGQVPTIEEYLSKTLEYEKSLTFETNIGIVNPSDFVSANSNIELCGSHKLIRENKDECKNSNYLVPSTTYGWTMNAFNGDNVVLVTSPAGDLSAKYANNPSEVYPVLFLKSNIKLKGNGTEQQPYEIK